MQAEYNRIRNNFLEEMQIKIGDYKWLIEDCKSKCYNDCNLKENKKISFFTFNKKKKEQQEEKEKNKKCYEWLESDRKGEFIGFQCSNAVTSTEDTKNVCKTLLSLEKEIDELFKMYEQEQELILDEDRNFNKQLFKGGLKKKRYTIRKRRLSNRK